MSKNKKPGCGSEGREGLSQNKPLIRGTQRVSVSEARVLAGPGSVNG